jgi:predicted HD phosphohydrolase
MPACGTGCGQCARCPPGTAAWCSRWVRADGAVPGTHSAIRTSANLDWVAAVLVHVLGHLMSRPVDLSLGNTTDRHLRLQRSQQVG